MKDSQMFCGLTLYGCIQKAPLLLILGIVVMMTVSLLHENSTPQRGTE
jgi:hypothetical protein